MDLNQILRKLSTSVSKNSPTILTGMSVFGLVSTVVLAVKATPKAMAIIEQEQIAKDVILESQDLPHELLTELEIVEKTWECYIPTFLMGTITVACMIGANKINMRRNAALASVFSVTEQALREYQAKVIERVGPAKEEAIRSEIAEDRVKANPPKDSTIIMTGKGDYLCFDTYSGRYFRSTVEDIRSAVNSFNQRLLQEGWMSINDFYDRLDLPGIELGNLVGWYAPHAILEVRYSSSMSPKNEPMLVMEYIVQPKQV